MLVGRTCSSEQYTSIFRQSRHAVELERNLRPEASPSPTLPLSTHPDEPGGARLASSRSSPLHDAQ